jgi:hypothetical protein
MRTLRLVLLPLVLVGCLKQVEGRVAGSDDEQLAAYEAKLEELRARGTAGEPSCAEQCDVATQTCGVAEHLCAVVERHPDRTDLPSRCVQARESCATGTERCTSCRTR